MIVLLLLLLLLLNADDVKQRPLDNARIADMDARNGSLSSMQLPFRDRAILHDTHQVIVQCHNSDKSSYHHIFFIKQLTDATHYKK